MTEWICTNCTARHDSNNPPCKNCACETFAKVDKKDEYEIEETINLEWECTQCGERHIKNNPPCNHCGGLIYEAVYLNSENEEGDSPHQDPMSEEDLEFIDSSNGQGVFASIGDVIFNKSTTRQLIDLELLLVTGFTWVFFLGTEFIYHHWRLSNGKREKSQYSYRGRRGEGIVTKFGKVLFWSQLILLALFIWWFISPT